MVNCELYEVHTFVARKKSFDSDLSGYLLYPDASLEVTNTGSKGKACESNSRGSSNESFIIVPSSLAVLCLQLFCHYGRYTTPCFNFGNTFHSSIMWCTDSTKKTRVTTSMFWYIKLQVEYCLASQGHDSSTIPMVLVSHVPGGALILSSRWSMT